MPHKNIFISHPIRSGYWKSDVQKIQDTLAQLRKLCRNQPVSEYPMAPYLLIAQTVPTYSQLVDYRQSFAHCPCKHGAAEFDELHLYGDDITDEMIAEASASIQRGIPVFIKNEAILCNPFAQAFVSIKASAA